MSNIEEMKFITTIVAILYMAACLAIGIYSKKRAEKGGKEFFASFKQFGWLLAGLAAAAAGMSAYGYVGGPGLAYKSGAAVWYMPWFFVLSYGMMTWLNGKPMRMMAEIARIETFPDLAHERYQCKWTRFFLSLNLVFCIWAYLGTQVLGGGLILQWLTGLDAGIAGVLLLLVTIIYTYYGGMVGSILVDGLQGFLMILSIIGAFIGCLMIIGSFDNYVTTVGSSSLGPHYVDPIGFPTEAMLPLVFSWIFVLAFGVVGQPHVNTKFYALKSYEDLRFKGFIGGVGYGIAGFMYMFPAIAVLYLVALGQVQPLKVADQAVFVFAEHIPMWVTVVIIMGLLAALMSTASSFLVIGSALFTRDIPKAFGKELSQKDEVRIGRIALLVLGLGACIFGLFGGYMVALLGVLGLGTFVAASLPVVIGYLWSRATKEAALIAQILVLVCSFGISVGYEKLLGLKLPGGIPGYVLYICLAVIVMIFVSLVTKGSAGDRLPEKMKVYFRHLE